jgi:MFS family permease
MRTTPNSNSSPIFRLSIWFVGVSFVLFQFFLQLSSGVIMSSIMHDMTLSALMAGVLSSSFYLTYTALQIPVGILFDQKNARTLLSVNALICSIGCFCFANSTTLTGLLLSRILMGAGSAFAFVGFSHVLRQYFPANQFAFMIGLSETMGFIATAISMIGMGEFIAHWGWRSFMQNIAWVGAIIAVACWIYIPNSPPKKPIVKVQHPLKSILSNRHIWFNGLFVGFSFSIVTVFGALWAVPFLQTKLGCGMQKAGFFGAAYFIGTGLSCPLFGFLSNYVKSRKHLILSSTLSTTVLLLGLLYIPTQNEALILGLTFFIGLFCGGYMLSYTISNELSPPHLQSTATGFTNTLAVLSALLLQPFVGYLLDILKRSGGTMLSNYQTALLVIPVCLLLGSVFIIYLPEKS